MLTFVGFVVLLHLVKWIGKILVETIRDFSFKENVKLEMSIFDQWGTPIEQVYQWFKDFDLAHQRKKISKFFSTTKLWSVLFSETENKITILLTCWIWIGFLVIDFQASEHWILETNIHTNHMIR